MNPSVGSLLMVGFEGTVPSPEITYLVSQKGVSGVILFTRNIVDPAQTRALCHALQALSPQRPLFIAIDQEGGRVARLPPPFPQFPAARTFGERGGGAGDSATVMARELLAVGINMNMAPVLDVDTNPNNPVIGDRSFGTDPKDVARLGCEVISAFLREGLIPCGKHFPGHGDTDGDSHLALPVVLHDLSRLRSVECVPFTAAIGASVPCLMTAHVLYPTLDDQWPASLSEKIITGLLRHTLQFEGIVISDDLEMKGVSLPPAEAAVRAVMAGSDLLLICRSFEHQTAALEALTDAVQRGEISERRLAESCHRLDHLRKRLSRESFPHVA